MTEGWAGGSNAPVPLTEAQRAALRPTVDVAALERFVAADPKRAHAALVHFSQPLEVPEARAEVRQLGGTDEHLADFDRMIAAGDEDEVAIVLVRVAPPADPRLRAMWDAIEPARP